MQEIKNKEKRNTKKHKTKRIKKKKKGTTYINKGYNVSKGNNIKKRLEYDIKKS